MKLWLDDIRNPADHGHPDAVWVRTASDAISILENCDVSWVSLDHDLGGLEIREIPNCGDGYEVACWLESSANFGGWVPPTMLCHSANPVGRARIEAALDRARTPLPLPVSPISRGFERVALVRAGDGIRATASVSRSLDRWSASVTVGGLMDDVRHASRESAMSRVPALIDEKIAALEAVKARWAEEVTK